MRATDIVSDNNECHNRCQCCIVVHQSRVTYFGRRLRWYL